MKQIFFVRNAQVWDEISKHVDKNSVAAVYNLDYFEKIPGDKLPEEIPLDGLERFKPDTSGGGCVSRGNCRRSRSAER